MHLAVYRTSGDWRGRDAGEKTGMAVAETMILDGVIYYVACSSKIPSLTMVVMSLACVDVWLFLILFANYGGNEVGLC